MFRSRIQKQQRVRYVFFGSKSHRLERMFCDYEDGEGAYSIGDPIFSRYVQSSPGKVNP